MKDCDFFGFAHSRAFHCCIVYAFAQCRRAQFSSAAAGNNPRHNEISQCIEPPDGIRIAHGKFKRNCSRKIICHLNVLDFDLCSMSVDNLRIIAIHSFRLAGFLVNYRLYSIANHAKGIGKNMKSG